LKQLLSLEDGKAVGLDGISPKLLRMGAPAIAAPLTSILNLSISTGIFPEEWKVARVVPIHKKGSLQDRGNFRPVSILCTLSKLLERHIHIAFYDFLKQFNLLHLAQSGFRNLFSCETALLNIVNKWTTAIDNDYMNGVILLDLRKAFDLIDHDLLLHKLKLYKCSNNTIKWFSSYLKGRSQCTVFKGKLSDKLPINTGVPQGSILGPLLFILFINDLPMVLEASDADMYADDSTLTAQAQSVPELEQKLTVDADIVSEWCADNHMAANATKTKVMLITT
jgi:retron-type reverse transcriptase